jgi:multisubunit Na+/H+ antiporter MnhB subunit
MFGIGLTELLVLVIIIILGVILVRRYPPPRQFSLRDLLLGMTIIALFLGIAVWLNS